MSFLSRSTAVENTRRKKRSESSSAIGRVRENRRIPTIEIVEDRDVATLVCVELSRAIMMNPELDLGVFLKTSSNSRRDISISDATLVITVAILDHIGNSKMAKQLLSRSSTITKYYDKMGLNDKSVREMLVTMLFALSPSFVSMLEASVRIAIDRSSDLNKSTESATRVARAMSTLSSEGVFSTDESIEAVERAAPNIDSFQARARRLSIQRTPTEMIGPDDSASIVARSPTRNRSLTSTQDDLMEFVKRRRTGNEPVFANVFPRSSEPITIAPRINKSGIGYTSPRDYLDKNEWANRVNNILGSARVIDVEHKTGNVTSRRPRVEDYLESEELSESVLYSPPLLKDDEIQNTNYKTTNRSYPTESFLPSTIAGNSMTTDRTLKFKSSLEELDYNLGLTKL